MTEDPYLDGASLLVVGEHVLAAARERPALGLALGRERALPSDPGMWYIGTRVARAPQATHSDVRFEGGAPPLRALAARIEGGEFGTWFGELKADADAGRVHLVRGAAAQRGRGTKALADAGRGGAPAGTAPVHRLAYPAAAGAAIRARHGRG